MPRWGLSNAVHAILQRAVIMPAEIVHRREKVRQFYGNTPWQTFYDWLNKGLIPPPDVELGPATPVWSAGLIARHQEERCPAAAAGREHGAQRGRKLRRRRDPKPHPSLEI